MTDTEIGPDPAPRNVDKTLEEVEYQGRHQGPRLAMIISVLCFVWSIFQMWIASPFPFMFDFAIITDVPARGIHLSFALLLCFLIYPFSRRHGERGLPVYDLLLALLAWFSAFYLFIGWDGLVSRQGILLVWNGIPIEAILGGIGILLLLDATRRSIGIPLVIVCGVFLIYSIFGQSMPDIISHKGLSLNRLIGYQWLTGEAVFGIPISVSVSFVFLFVLFGALLDKAGAGQYFLALSFAMVGRFSGGPAKAAILASGMTGMISGSSIANVVTTGTFTIPVMRRIGMPAVKAGAIEVAASTNGQIMPPIMGAAAFIIAEFIGISYFDVVVAAAIPASLSYIALLYISHLEAQKLGLKGLPSVEIPPLGKTFRSGLHHLIPIIILVYLLMVERWSAHSAVFYSILSLMGIILARRIVHSIRFESQPMAEALRDGFTEIYLGMVAGARNMVGIAVAVAAAGIIVGAVSSTGLNNAMVGVVEALAGGNVYILLGLTAVLCIFLGMGLPTTANYLVVASLLAGVLVELGNAAGLVLPLIAVHLYVFYYGLLADSTPPVCLAAFAAAAISRADPLKTGVQSFLYDIRTAVLPLVFLFNTELLLIGIESIWHGVLVVFMSLLAILAFSSLTQGWLIVKVKWYESILLAVACFMLFRPGFFMDELAPPFEPVNFEAFASGEFTPESGRYVRLHVVRETNYGERFKLFVFETPEDQAATVTETFGVTIEPEEDGRYAVVDLAFNGTAEKAGLDWGDYVTGVDVEQLDLPDKQLIYPVGVLLLGLVWLSQRTRRRRIDGTAAPA
ncbi:MAG: TRAP transporter permease [Rhodospirillaceae bacterium]|jgi:TRAP transporter 4TM/12TM fusion protein|nr:TRAP transporter permease [Rhodospirillaceae bacterium]